MDGTRGTAVAAALPQSSPGLQELLPRFSSSACQSSTGPCSLPAVWWATDPAHGARGLSSVPGRPTGPGNEAGPTLQKQSSSLQKCLGPSKHPGP